MLPLLHASCQAPCVFGVGTKWLHTLRVSAGSYGCPLDDLRPPPVSTQLVVVGWFVRLYLLQAWKQVGQT